VRDLVPAIVETLAIPAFEPAKLELELVAHTNAAHLARHRDTRVGPPNGKPYRAISAVYYFFRQPKSFTGGVLRLHSMAATGAAGSFVDIEPENDTLVFFPSWFMHEVSPVVCPSGQFEDSRFAVNCWVLRR
jgi:SM-20-related protein